MHSAIVLFPLIFLVSIASLIHIGSALMETREERGSNIRPLIIAGIFLGIGLGGFADGIVFHQILQTHNMLSAWLPPDTLENARVNMFWDGMFHAFTWLVVVAGLCLLWRAGEMPGVSWSGRVLAGAGLAGWGLFNLVEGIIDHHLLGVHHVVEKLGMSVYDYLFLLSGLVFVAVGTLMIRPHREAGRRAKTVTASPTSA
jgi:uncharacterized membrane protein